jgi:hypothetical protein
MWHDLEVSCHSLGFTVFCSCNKPEWFYGAMFCVSKMKRKENCSYFQLESWQADILENNNDRSSSVTEKQNAKVSNAKVQSLWIHAYLLFRYERNSPLQLCYSKIDSQPSISTFKFRNVYGKALVDRDQIFGRTSGFLIVTMRRRTHTF